VNSEEAALKEFLRTQSRQLVDILALRTSSYMVAAWRVLGPTKGDLKQIAQQASLDPETLERWVKYLGNSPREHPLLDKWDDLLPRGAPEAEVKRFADKIQELLVSVIREKKGGSRACEPWNWFPASLESYVTLLKPAIFFQGGSPGHDETGNAEDDRGGDPGGAWISKSPGRCRRPPSAENR
jgi:hypothetical protein